MGFVEVTNRLMASKVGLQEIAEALGVSYSTARATRLPLGSPSYRNPPKGWEKALASLARQRSGDLAVLAVELERGVSG